MLLGAAQNPQLMARARARVGTMLGPKYRLDALLGVGGMASVYRATHRNGAIFAIKILHPEYATRGDVRVRFLREGYIANSIRHAGVARVVDDEASESGDVYIVMELLEGVSVDRVLTGLGGRMPLRAVVALGLGVLDVLEAAHAASVVHRDIKPANLFVGFDGRVLLLDFGIARVYDAATTGGFTTEAGIVLGTPAYMAPEQASGKRSEVGARTDLWSLGATMFTLAAGRTVHLAENGEQFLLHSATRDAPAVRDVIADAPEPIASVLDRALAYDPAQRWADAAEMRDALISASHAAWGGVPGAGDIALLFAPTGATIAPLEADALTRIAPLVQDAPPPGLDAFFRAIVQTVRELGFDADAALVATGIDPKTLGEHQPTSSHLVDFLEHAARIANEPSIGVKTAIKLPLGAGGALDYATRTSNTLRDAIERTARLFSYVSERVRLILEEDGDRVHLVYRPNEGAPTGPQVTEFLVSVVLMRARDALRTSVPVTSVSFRHARVEGGLDLAELLGAPVSFEQARDEIVMPRSVLFLRFETSDPMVADLLERHAERLTQRPGH